MNLATMQAHIEERLDDAGELLTLAGMDHGLVLWSRPEDHIPGGTEYIVHRWATSYSDGSPVARDIFFYSGGYYDTHADALADFNNRRPGNRLGR